VERFVLISTDKAVNPCSVMGASKRICELLIQALATCERNQTVFAAVRFGNVLGSRGSVVPIFNRQIEADGPVTVTDENMVRYFMSIPEAVSLVIHAACLTTGSDLFMLRMGDAVPIIELAERMIRLRGLRPRIDIPIEFTGVRPGEKLFEELCAESEESHSTLHPDIVRLNGMHYNWSPPLFLAQVRQLHPVNEADNKAVLQMLTQLAQSVLYERAALPV
jgi:FlaA1/EpsC-like NDP-sugar epimerase